MLRIDRRAIESKVANAPRLRRDQPARVIISRGLSDVDRVADAIDHIEIVAGEGGTEERLLIAQAQIDTAENGGRTFEPFPQRLARQP